MQKPNVISLETAKRLKELRVDKPSVFSWFPQIGFTKEEQIDDDIVYEEAISSLDTGWYVASNDSQQQMRPNITPAYLADEVLAILPKMVSIISLQGNVKEYWLTIKAQSHGYLMGYTSLKYGQKYKRQAHASLSEAAGLLLVHLIENNIINTNKE